MALVSIFIACPAIAAQEKQKENITMEEVIVVASPIIEGNKVIDSGGQVTVIDKNQLTDLNARDLPSALRRTPGVTISRHNHLGSFGGAEGGAIYIRGMGSSRPGGEIQMLVDGVPKFAGVWSHPLMDLMNTDIAQGIEVYKGAQPVLFGNMGFGAVNIISKRRQEQGFATVVEGAAGSYHTLVELFEHGGKIKDTDYYFIQSFKKSGGHRENAGGELQNYFARIGHRLSGIWSLAVTASFSHSYADDPGPEGRPQERQGTYKLEDNLTVITLSHDLDEIKGELKLYWNNGEARWLRQFDLVNFFHYDTNTTFDNYGVRSREVLQPWRGGVIMAGADLDFTSGKVFIDRDAPRPDAEFPGESFRIFSPYLSLSQKFGLSNNWEIVPSAGVRYYRHGDFDAQWTPQAGLVFKNMSTDLHVFYSRGINYPGLYVAAQSKMLWGNNTKWKELKPETVEHFEAGVSRWIGRKIRADFTYFYDQGKNRLIIIASPAPPHYENIASFERQGLEATLNINPFKHLSLFAGGTWLARRLPDNLPYSPRWMASAGANLKLFARLKISLDTLYQDSQYVANNRALDYGGSSIARVDGFWILNSKIGWEFYWPSSLVASEIFIAGENLTDVSYAYKKDYPMPGINGMIGINIKF